MADPQRWWLRPYRQFQTNLREIDAPLDVERTVARILELGANSWLLNTAGIVSFYPTALPYQHPSPWLKERPSGDLIGDAVQAAHARGVRLISRCDFSKVHRAVYEAHPDWCYVSPRGEPQIYNGLYSTCPSAPYYQEKAFEIIGEILDRYPIDGFFFNMFSFPLRDYSRVYYGICQCGHCRRRFAERYRMALPREEDWNDPAYLAWREYSRETIDALAGRVRAFIKERRPDACLMLRHNPDVVMHEVNNAVDRPQPLWFYWAGECAKETRTAYPDRPTIINSVMFLDIPYRFSAEQPGLIGLSLAQTIAHGAYPWAYVIGTTDQPDRKNFGIVGTMLRFHRDHERYYAGLRSAAKVAVVSSLRSEERYAHGQGDEKVVKERRGVYRALVEGHVPFDILPDGQLVAAAQDGRLARYEAIVLPNVAALNDAQLAALDRYVEDGGGLVATYDSAAFDADGASRPGFGLRSLGAERIAARREGPQAMRSAYLRVTRREDLPDSDDTDFVALDRAYLYVEPRHGAVPSFRLIPPERYGPPEKCYWDVETDYPGLLWHTHGRGRTAYFPWPIGALFFDLSLPEHRTLLVNAVSQVARGGRQVITSAPPQVEVVVGEQPDERRTLVHLINYTGHHGRSFDDPIDLRDVRVDLAVDRPIRRVWSAGLGRELGSEQAARRVSFVLPRLNLFDLIVLEE